MVTHAPVPLPPRKTVPIPIVQEAVLVPQLAWTFWRQEKSQAPALIRTPDRPARSLITVMTTVKKVSFPQKVRFCPLQQLSPSEAGMFSQRVNLHL